jgi:hypothetical protein
MPTDADLYLRGAARVGAGNRRERSLSSRSDPAQPPDVQNDVTQITEETS